MNSYGNEGQLVAFEGFDLSQVGDYLTKALETGAQTAGTALLSQVASTPEVQNYATEQATQQAAQALAQKQLEMANQLKDFYTKNRNLILYGVGGVATLSIALFIYSRKRRKR